MNRFSRLLSMAALAAGLTLPAVAQEKSPAKPLHLSAGTIEAYSTGDADILNSPLMKRLYREKEKVTDGKHESVTIMIVITK